MLNQPVDFFDWLARELAQGMQYRKKQSSVMSLKKFGNYQVLT